ncbi:hypothetical protein OQA88_851 [Cercophora sp. LCS_1]
MSSSSKGCHGSSNKSNGRSSGGSKSGSRTAQTTASITMASICVQPPNQTSIQTQMYPPVVARARVNGINQSYTYVFAMAVLLNGSGNVLGGELGGNTVTTGMSLPDDGGSSSDGSSRSGSNQLYFAFTDLFTTYVGTYSIRVDIYLVDYGDTEGARMLSQAETRSFDVYDNACALERCALHEKRLLQRLRDQGMTIPATPAT